MSVRRSKPASEVAAEWLGAAVHSKRVGRKAGFDGTVIDRHPGAGLAFIVEDGADGSRWHRTIGELRRLVDVRGAA